ncbi:MAG: hypothetical protein NZ739_12315, partial [Verrucomicrobiae bacterium]|nr:hypothetical protein [Verrucomicrobiae bacterium]
AFAGNNFDPQSLHKYAYCHCDPVNGTDPSGCYEFNLVSTLKAASLSAGLNIAVNFLAGERNPKKLLVHGLIAGVAGAVAGPIIGKIDELIPLNTVGAHFIRAFVTAIATGAIAATFNVVQQCGDALFFGEKFDGDKVKLAFATAAVIGLIGDFYKGDRFDLDPKAAQAYDVQLGYLAEWVGLTTEKLLVIAKKVWRTISADDADD